MGVFYHNLVEVPPNQQVYGASKALDLTISSNVAFRFGSKGGCDVHDVVLVMDIRI